MEPITDIRDISRIAYGFMASKALFAALQFDLFSQLSQGPKTVHEIASRTGIQANQLLTLLTACVSLGLMSADGNQYRNAPACERYLVRGARNYFGDYYRFQIDRQIYPRLEHLEAALHGESVPPLYEMMAEQSEAEQFSRSQHAGSLGPALIMARQLDLSGCHALLDVAGGSGAFSITLCQHNPDLHATILDFPNVVEIAKRYVAEENLAGRIEILPGNALELEWPAEQDVVLMSYLLSAIAENQISTCLEQALRSLKPGGRVVVHDFMVRDDRTGPLSAALWFLPNLLTPGTISLTPAWLQDALVRTGFAGPEVSDLIPGITKLIVAHKP